MENGAKKRGLKKGSAPTWNVGRKATGRVRNVTVSFKVTEDERKAIYDALSEIGKGRTDSLLKALNIGEI